MDVTPLFVIERLVVCDPETVIPVPPATTGAVIVTAPVAALTLMPVPARLVTPVLLTLRVVVPLIPMPVPAAIEAAIVGVVVPVTVMPLPAVTDVTPPPPPPPALVPNGPLIRRSHSQPR
jgi:hypothetical protein